MGITKIRKRDGSIVDFNKEKIINAIFKAAQSVGGSNRSEAETVADLVVKYISEKFAEAYTPTVEEIQDLVEKALIESGHAATAKSYIIYRHRKNIEREMKKALGVEDDLKLPLNSIQVLEKRYLLKDETGKTIETPSGLFRRVARHLASNEMNYGADETIAKRYEDAFYQVMTNFEFLPNSPALMNAGTGIGQLSACFVLPVKDDIEQIFESVKHQAIIHKTGGGTGFCFSYLRPKGDFVKSTAGVASGPISFMSAFDNATNVIKQGGKRRGANMATLHVWHPDIEEFITMKQTPGVMENFNVSVMVDDKFMQAVEANVDYDLTNPRNGQVIRKVNARSLFKLIAYSAWKSAEPGLLFIDEINRKNPTPDADIHATNPCGEVPMPDYESCNLGSINLVKFVELDWSKTNWKKKVDWNRLRYVTRVAFQFLDNVIDLNKYPIPQIKEQTMKNRRIGLGVMGFSRMLFKMGIRYDSELGYEVGEQIMKFIEDEATKMSHELGRARGSFPNFKNSPLSKQYDAMRNATCTSIAPTGTISMIANTSSGIEPVFALSFLKTVRAGQYYYCDDIFEHVMKVRGLYSQELMQKIMEEGTIAHIDEVPDDVKNVFRVSHDISPESHVLMQSAFQKNVGLAVSKTINMPANATVEDVENVYLLAWKSGCKGITIYRDSSRSEQVLHVGKTVKTKGVEEDKNVMLQQAVVK
ncbi:Vitamin B12-dependent ribonucleoside-diphosphate reductase [Candidatus Bilamarchaeum dharawalense]|uniref:Vitamin B12-dependent ribonucleotide reductase n=1 Tax=Candidatus Bilamarchaeum dharawalense TaxID=2885759 RepID=A0A5E4LKD9_9ARCH|nr:Vitamin B12-dependent ribonucleoside-diphosphate reductase [Candidatus Bilamarchaeum dharawalense]